MTPEEYKNHETPIKTAMMKYLHARFPGKDIGLGIGMSHRDMHLSAALCVRVETKVYGMAYFKWTERAEKLPPTAKDMLDFMGVPVEKWEPLSTERQIQNAFNAMVEVLKDVK